MGAIPPTVAGEWDKAKLVQLLNFFIFASLGLIEIDGWLFLHLMCNWGGKVVEKAAVLEIPFGHWLL